VKPRTRLILPLAVASLALGLAACGKKADDDHEANPAKLSAELEKHAADIEERADQAAMASERDAHRVAAPRGRGCSG